MSEYKYFILHKTNFHALGVTEESDTTITVRILTTHSTVKIKRHIIPSLIYAPRVVPKDDLSEIFDDVEITKSYDIAFKYLTGELPETVTESGQSH